MKLMLDKIIISTIQQRTHDHQNWYATLMPFSSSLFLIVFHDILMINFNFFDSLGCQFLVIWDNYQNETEKKRKKLAFIMIKPEYSRNQVCVANFGWFVLTNWEFEQRNKSLQPLNEVEASEKLFVEQSDNKLVVDEVVTKKFLYFQKKVLSLLSNCIENSMEMYWISIDSLYYKVWCYFE